jgi:hypothetical protein
MVVEANRIALRGSNNVDGRDGVVHVRLRVQEFVDTDDTSVKSQ